MTENANCSGTGTGDVGVTRVKLIVGDSLPRPGSRHGSSPASAQIHDVAELI